MKYKDELRVSLGLLLVAFLAATIVGFWLSLLGDGSIGIIYSYKVVSVLILAGFSLYYFVRLLKWCFKPLENK